MVKIRETKGASGEETAKQSSVSLLYAARLEQGDTIVELYSALYTFAPAVYANLPRSKFGWQEEAETGDIICTVTYSAQAREESGGGSTPLKRGWDSTGGTVRIYGALQTARVNAPGKVAPDYKGLIGVRDGDPEGVDIVIPTLKLNYKYTWPENVITNTYIRNLAGLVGTTNSAVYDGYAPGELLFLGTSGELVPNFPTDITYIFAASADATLTLAGVPGIAKGGHDYLWIAYQDNVDSSANRVGKEPLGIYIERVYRRSGFGALGIL